MQSSSHTGRATWFPFMLLHMQSWYRWAKPTGSEIKERALWGGLQHKSDFPFNKIFAVIPSSWICKSYFHSSNLAPLAVAGLFLIHLFVFRINYAPMSPVWQHYVIRCRLFSITPPSQKWRWYLDFFSEARAHYLDQNWELNPYLYLDKGKIFFPTCFIRQRSIKIGLNPSYSSIRHQALGSLR